MYSMFHDSSYIYYTWWKFNVEVGDRVLELLPTFYLHKSNCFYVTFFLLQIFHENIFYEGLGITGGRKILRKLNLRSSQKYFKGVFWVFTRKTRGNWRKFLFFWNWHPKQNLGILYISRTWDVNLCVVWGLPSMNCSLNDFTEWCLYDQYSWHYKCWV